jgi:urea carboxylase system permease
MFFYCPNGSVPIGPVWRSPSGGDDEQEEHRHMARTQQPAGPDSADEQHLASLGYRQELTRSLGSFSTFATGFAFISVLTGIFQLFFFGFASAGPAFWWITMVTAVGAGLFALVFAELSANFPLAGSVYNWSKQVASQGTSWLAGVSITLAFIVSTASVALALQFVLPSISNFFWFYGNGNGTYDAATNGVIIGVIMIVLSTIINVLGIKVIAIIQNIGVTVELLTTVLLIITFAIKIKRGPGVILQTQGTGAGHSAGYLGAMLVALLFGAYLQWGFDTAGSVAEETINPRKTSPKAILRAYGAAALSLALLLLLGMMAAGDIHSQQLSITGFPYIVTSALGNGFGKFVLVCVSIAIFVCCVANQTSAIRMLFAMARDNTLPGSPQMAKVNRKLGIPVIPTLITGIVPILILLINVRQPQIFTVVTSCVVIFAIFAYVLVCGPFALTRMRGKWQEPGPGYFSLRRWGLPVSIAAFVWGVFVIIDIAWPRDAVYNATAPFHWYLKWAGVLVPGIVLALCYTYYWLRARHHIGVLETHAAQPAPAVAKQIDDFELDVAADGSEGTHASP